MPKISVPPPFFTAKMEKDGRVPYILKILISHERGGEGYWEPNLLLYLHFI